MQNEQRGQILARANRPENKVSLDFVEGLNNKICVIQRRAYGLRDEEYLRLKILTCMLPALTICQNCHSISRRARILDYRGVHIELKCMVKADAFAARSPSAVDL